MGRRYAWVFSFLFIFFMLPTVTADMGMVSPGDIWVYEPGQKAIIAWNGEREVLILSTDVWASENTWALELLPLPSQPDTPEAGSFDSFVEVQGMIGEYMWDVYDREGGTLGPGEGLEILFHENIGAHDITGFRVTSASQLIDFAENLLEGKGLTQEVSWDRLEGLAEIYLQRGVSYWVLDLIDLSDHMESREPIIYTFVTDYLYFPLEISSLASGDTEITLFTLTENNLDASSVENAGFSIASFTAGGEDFPIKFEVDENELNRISPEVAELFEGPAWLTALTYEGPLEDLKGDLMLDHVGAAAPTAEVNDLLAIAWGIGIVLVLLGIFAVVYKISPYYKTSPSVTKVG